MTKDEFIAHQPDGIPEGYEVVSCQQSECGDRCCPGWKVAAIEYRKLRITIVCETANERKLLDAFVTLMETEDFEINSEEFKID